MTALSKGDDHISTPQMNKYFPKILNSTKALACGMKMI
jgi:hypothetical protein